MKTHANFPNQYDASTAQIINELHTLVMQLQQKIAILTAKNQWFEARDRLNQKRRFGASSEKTTSLQQEFQFVFNEAEELSSVVPQAEESSPAVSQATEEPEIETITYKRRKHKGLREAQLAHLPEEIVEHRLPEKEQICPCCAGKLHEMNKEVRSRYKSPIPI
jgi:hypothetical protein